MMSPHGTGPRIVRHDPVQSNFAKYSRNFASTVIGVVSSGRKRLKMQRTNVSRAYVAKRPFCELRTHRISEESESEAQQPARQTMEPRKAGRCMIGMRSPEDPGLKVAPCLDEDHAPLEQMPVPNKLIDLFQEAKREQTPQSVCRNVHRDSIDLLFCESEAVRGEKSKRQWGF